MSDEYEITIAWSDDDQTFVAKAPALPGCAAHGDTWRQAVDACREAIALWIEIARATGRAVPAPPR